MHIELIFTNIGYVLSTIATIVVAIVVLTKSTDWRTKVIFSLLSAALVVFELSHLFGINVHDSYLSQSIFMFNLSNIFIICFDIHFVFYVLGIARKKIIELTMLYGVGVSLFVFYISYPNTFLLTSVPKLYLPNYYNPGEWYFLMLIFMVIGVGIIVYQLLSGYSTTSDLLQQRRIKYYLVGHLFGYGFGLTAHFLSFGIPIDPIWSVFIGFYTIFFAYAMIKYDLLEIRVVAKQALLYSSVVFLCGFSIATISYANVWIARSITGYPIWLIPLLSGFIAVGIGHMVLRKIKEVDHLKYEFINVVSHKFRTPLTYMRWSLDSADEATTLEQMRTHIDEIKEANKRLVELTDILVTTANIDDENFMYMYAKESLEGMVRKVVNEQMEIIRQKGITVNYTITERIPLVIVDVRKIEYVIQILIENAVVYNKENGSINIHIFKKGSHVVLQVHDTGIGIDRNNVNHMFSTFYRGHDAMTTDTEGVGLGLYIAKNILKQHDADIHVESEGKGRGAMFTVVFKRTA